MSVHFDFRIVKEQLHLTPVQPPARFGLLLPWFREKTVLPRPGTGDFGLGPAFHSPYFRAMSKPVLKVLCVVGSLKARSVTRVVVREAARQLESSGCAVDVLDLQQEPLAVYNPDTAQDTAAYLALQPRVLRADVILLGTPDYHGSISSALKNFLDHFWHEFAGKLFATVVASHEKGLTVTDQLRTVARQCYAWSLPYGLSFLEKADVSESHVINESLRKKLGMLTRDVRVYGEILARQRRADLACADDCFMAKHRGQSAH